MSGSGSGSSSTSTAAVESSESCQRVDKGKSTGHGIFITDPSSSSSLPSNVVPLSEFIDKPLYLVNEDGTYNNKDDKPTFGNALSSDQGNIILIVRRPG